jgi:hypothetical protein
MTPFGHRSPQWPENKGFRGLGHNCIYLINGICVKIILDKNTKQKYNGNNSKQNMHERRGNTLAG